MQDHGPHCPFLNRTDERCSKNFSLERLDHAFAYCFGGYSSCPVYLERLLERRVRRLSGGCAPGVGIADAKPLVQITFAHAHRQHAA